MLEAKGSGKCTDFRAVVGSRVAYNLYLPVILCVANGGVAIARNFPVGFGDRCSNCVRVQVSAGLCVNQSDDRLVLGKSKLLIGLVVNLTAVGVEEPVVVRVLVVVACNLLLHGALWIGLDVRVEQSTTVTHVLQGDARAICDLEWAVLADLGSAQVGLEEGAHLRISGAAVLQNEEMQVETEGVDRQRDEDEAEDAEGQVCEKLNLGHFEIAKLVPEILNSVDSDESGDEETDPLHTADASNRYTSQHQPQAPLRRERILLLAMKLGPAEDSREGEAEEHGVEKNEAADGCVRVLAEDGQSDEPDGRPPKVQLLCGEVRERNADGTESGVEEAHEGVVQFFRVSLARLELKRAIVSSKVS